MKFRLRDRIALAIYSLLGFVAAALFAGVGYLLYTGMLHVQLPLLGRAGSMIAANVLAVIMLVYSAFMLRLAFKHKPKKDKNSVTVATSEQGNGEVRVSVQALDALVEAHKLTGWNGFDKVDRTALDGTDFELTIGYEDGRKVCATGSNAFPKGYREAREAILELFGKMMDRNGIENPL